ncbi:MAG: lipase family protein [Deltaproteobacteria bacterium]|nr:lipase family protein [Deltaproteobacteria bacterium]
MGSLQRRCIPFGQPRVGDESYGKSFTKNMGDIPYFREVFRNDPVTQVPPEGTGFAHISSATVAF